MGFLLPIPLRLKPSSLGLFCWKMAANGGSNGGGGKWWQMAGGGSGGNIGGYIGGKKHKPPFPLSRRFKMALTLDPSDSQYMVGLTFYLFLSLSKYIF